MKVKFIGEKGRKIMKIVAFNGSPNKEGITYHSIKMVTEVLESSGVETEIIQVGHNKIRGCMACQKCYKNRDMKCVFDDDPVNDWIEKMVDADGIILGTPVHYAGVAGTMKSFLDRAFYVIGANGNGLRNKVGVSLAAVRRSGGITAVDQLNKYLEYSEMVMPSSNYWNVIHGARAGEVLKDQEGVQILETLGKRMLWALELVENGKESVDIPSSERKVFMNFIR
jgi:multimeric flavodoxin WrbA